MLAPLLKSARVLTLIPKFDKTLALHVGGLVFTALLLFTQLSQRELWPSHEARAAQEAQQFLTTNSWGVHHLFDGSNDYQKPPLYYWLVASAAWLGGGTVDAFCVRLPAAIGGWITVLAVVQFLRRRNRPVAATIAGLMLATSCHFLAIARTGRIDVPLTAAITVAIIQMIQGRWIVAGIAIAVGLLLKGPVGLVLPVAVVTAVGILRASELPVRWTVLASSALVGLAIAAPWYVYAGFETNWEFWRVFFWHHNVARATGSADELARHPFWFYFARWIIDWLPWSPAFFFFAIRVFWKNNQPCDFEMHFGMTWMMVVTLLLSLSQFKRADYLIPAYPGAAIALGCCLETLYFSLPTNNQTRARHGLMGVLILTVATYYIIDQHQLSQEQPAYPHGEFAKQIRQQAPPDRPIIFFRVEDHLLAFHLKPPLISVNEWENLDVWIKKNGLGVVLMPADAVSEISANLHNGNLQEIGRMTSEGETRSPRTWIAFRSRSNEYKSQHE